MITGKSPTDPMFSEGLNLHNFAKMALPDHVKKIVEPKLLGNNEEVERTTSNNMPSLNPWAWSSSKNVGNESFFAWYLNKDGGGLMQCTA
ncbi:hypothetical protein LguiA_030779 [Lonicera macranthoides]